jgi:hypothetical protein
LRNTHIVCPHIRQFVLEAPFRGVKDIQVRVYTLGNLFHNNLLLNLRHQRSNQTLFVNNLLVGRYDLQ